VLIADKSDEGLDAFDPPMFYGYFDSYGRAKPRGGMDILYQKIHDIDKSVRP
jgi:hypothetical protein